MSTETVIFENSGLIDLRAIKTFGVSVKEGENPFGFFGTGLKYAIGILLRNQCKITIYRGLERFDFSTATSKIRGEDFSIITINGEELGFTTQIGKNWELWQAYRELYCNTLDEGGEVTLSHKPTLELRENSTTVTVESEAFASIHRRRREFILQSIPMEVIDNVEIHAGQANGIFYKRIFIGGLGNSDSPKTALTYNILDNVALTEDRTLRDLFSAEWEIVTALKKSNDPDTLRAVLIAEGGLEKELHFGYNDSRKPGKVFMEVMEELLSDHSIKVNDSAVRLHTKHSKKDLTPKPTTLSVVQQKQLEKAVVFCTHLGFFNINDFPIVVTETLGKGCLGLAQKGTIYLAKETFDMGTKMVAITLIEEYIHLKHGYADMTRSMQNHLFNKIISLGEELAGEPL